MRFSGHVAVVTGAAGALGRATAKVLASEGAQLVLFDCDIEGLTLTQMECPGAITVVGDVTSSGDLERAKSVAEAHFGTVDLVAAAAGIAGSVAPLVEVDEREFDRLMSINVKGAWLTAKSFLPPMRAIGRGAAVFFSSTAGIAGSPFLPAYSVSKGAVTLLTRSLALSHAAENIRVNCVCPGTIASRMVDDSLAAVPDPAERAVRTAALKARHPMNRFGTVEEVAHAVAYLLSDEAGFTTGVALPVDGGRLA